MREGEMPSASAALARCKDPGSVHCRIWSQAEVPPEKPPPEVPSRDLVTDSYRFLVRREAYPDADRVTSCLSLADFEEGERSKVLRAILHSAWESPGTYVRGANKLPRYRDEAKVFYRKAGFDQFTIELLTAGLAVNPLAESSEDTELDPKNEAESSFS